MIAEVQHRQSVFDVALQVFGTAEAAFIVAEKLGCSITDPIEAGSTLEYGIEEVVDKHVADYYRKNGIIPTTEIE